MVGLTISNTEGDLCVCRLTERVAVNFITLLDVRPGAGTYIVAPAHPAIHERDNAASFLLTF
jgi:hypothetical protein